MKNLIINLRVDNEAQLSKIIAYCEERGISLDQFFSEMFSRSNGYEKQINDDRVFDMVLELVSIEEKQYE
jgi:hypothetical protein